MKKNLIFGLILLLSIPGLTQNLKWAKRFGGNGYDQGQALTIDGSANVYTTGIFGGVVDFDPGADVFNLTAPSYGVFILKLDASGSFIWAKGLSGSGNISSYSIMVDGSGNVIVTGQFAGTIDFDPGAAVLNITSAGFADIFIFKLDASGSFVWAKTMGGTNEDHGISSSFDVAGNIYTTGYFRGTADFNPGAGITEITSAGFADIFVSKLDASGNFIWVKSIGTSSFEQSRDIATDPSGNVLITGSFTGTMDFDPGPATFNMTTTGNSSVYIFKIDPAGTFVWARMMGGAANTGSVSLSIHLDHAGSIYTTGYFNGAVDFNPGAGVANLVTQLPQDADIFVSKLDASGNYVWAKSMGGLAGSTETGTGIAVDITGNVYTTGYFAGTSDFDPGTGVYNLTAVNSDHDVFVSKLDANGSFMWAGKWGGVVEDQPLGIAVDASQNIYTTGYFEGTTDFDPSAGTFNLTPPAGSDIFISKLGVTALPVSLLNFDAARNNNDTYLTWKTGTEVNTDKFEIERSRNGIVFSSIGEVKASGNSNTIKTYSYVDKNAGINLFNQRLYYRFKQFDLDGLFTYSSIQSVKFDKKELVLATFPNPASNMLLIEGGENYKEIQIISMLGTVLKKVKASANLSLDISHLPAGRYFIGFTGNGTEETISFLKQ